MPLVKVLSEIAGASFSALVGIFAATDNTLITVTAITAVLGFAGLLVRQVVVAQKAIWEIVKAKESEAEAAKDEAHYAHWELERLRYAYGERVIDPGPYSSRGKVSDD